MNKKCLSTIISYALYLVTMISIAYLVVLLNFDNMYIKLAIAAVLLVIAIVLSTLIDGSGFIVLTLNAISWGLLVSLLFDAHGAPSLIHVSIISAVTLAWYIIYCFFVKLKFFNEHYTICMFVWSFILIAGLVAFALTVRSILGWFSLILIAPYLIFFVSLIMSAENLKEHIKNISLASTIPLLIISIIATWLKNPIGAFDIPDMLPDVDTDNVYDFENKTKLIDDITEEK